MVCDPPSSILRSVGCRHFNDCFALTGDACFLDGERKRKRWTFSTLAIRYVVAYKPTKRCKGCQEPAVQRQHCRQ